jgi:FixJ family two-component response regulator
VTVAGIARVVVVDDDESVRDSTRTLLKSAGYEVATFESAELYLSSGKLDDAACLVLDIRMQGMDGLQLQRHLQSLGIRTAIVFITAHDTQRNRRLALENGAVDFLSKPFEAWRLVTAVRAAVIQAGIEEPGN